MAFGPASPPLAARLWAHVHDPDRARIQPGARPRPAPQGASRDGRTATCSLDLGGNVGPGGPEDRYALGQGGLAAPRRAAQPPRDQRLRRRHPFRERELGALQELQVAGVLSKARYLVSVSGGGYTAGAYQMALTGAGSSESTATPRDVLAPGSVEEDHVRRHSKPTWRATRARPARHAAARPARPPIPWHCRRCSGWCRSSIWPAWRWWVRSDGFVRCRQCS